MNLWIKERGEVCVQPSRKLLVVQPGSSGLSVKNRCHRCGGPKRLRKQLVVRSVIGKICQPKYSEQ